MTHANEWLRVTQKHPCPICGKPDWCLVAGPLGQPHAILCARIESKNRRGDAGWLHQLRDQPKSHPRSWTVPCDVANSRDWDSLCAFAQRNVDPQQLQSFAQTLGLQARSLLRLRIGWLPKTQNWTLPLFDADGRIIGMHTRDKNKSKRFLKGSQSGVFLPLDLFTQGPIEELLICEGASDAAAMLSLGFNSVARVSCNSGLNVLLALCQRLKPASVVIVGDADEPGRRGAEQLAVGLLLVVPLLRVIFPPEPIKDARDWLLAGAQRPDVQAVIAEAEPRRLQIHFSQGEQNQ